MDQLYSRKLEPKNIKLSLLVSFYYRILPNKGALARSHPIVWRQSWGSKLSGGGFRLKIGQLSKKLCWFWSAMTGMSKILEVGVRKDWETRTEYWTTPYMYRVKGHYLDLDKAWRISSNKTPGRGLGTEFYPSEPFRYKTMQGVF